MKLDEKNCKILNLLQKNCRMSYTDLAKEIGLSVDSTKKRVERMIKYGVFNPKIQIRPRSLGYPYIVDVKTKLHNYDEQRIQEFIGYVINHPRVAEAFSISGEYNFSLVFFAKNYEDVARLSNEIRNKFNNIISEWNESLTTVAYKFEQYDMLKLKKYEEKVNPHVPKP